MPNCRRLRALDREQKKRNLATMSKCDSVELADVPANSDLDELNCVQPMARNELEANIPLTDPSLATNLRQLDFVPKVNGDGDDEDVAMDRELAKLRKRYEILTLRRQIENLERGIPDPVVGATPTIGVVDNYPCQPLCTYQQIEGTIAEFTGDDSYGIDKWIADFEIIVAPLNCDDNFRLICARRLMKGTAQIWLRTTTASTWLELRRKLVKQFRRMYSVSDILRDLAQVEYDQKLGLNNYILRMKEIASHGPDIGETDLVKQIISGLRDKSTRMGLLYSARSLNDLHRIAPDYDQLRRDATVPSCANSAANTKRPISNFENTTGTTTNPLCFNCSEKGHLSRNCPKPKRAHGSCFRCGGTDHTIRTCPKLPSTNMNLRVGFIGDEVPDRLTTEEQDETASALPTMNLSG